MMKSVSALKAFIIVGCFGAVVRAGPYNEAGICSYIGPDEKCASPGDPNAVINPIFRGWAAEVESYEPTPYTDRRNLLWFDPTLALGPSMGDPEEGFYTVSLGDLYQESIVAGVPPGQITLSFSETIRNQKGYDFAVFENGFRVTENEYFCELGYVEVSSNGVDFARFPSAGLMTIPEPNGYYFLDITDVYNLAGKHPNNGGQFTGTPFDLSDLANEPNVLNGSVDLNNISYVRIVDIPGSGDFKDEGRKHIDPCTWPDWDYYDTNHPIYDAWPTWGSDGMDLEAIGVLHPQQYGGDINLDGIVDYADLEIFAQGWLSHFGQEDYLSRCDLATPKDLIVDFSDFAVFASEWRKVEQWHFSF
jgi:hypothetical protein